MATYFWDTVETIPGGVGFSHFSTPHLIWLGVFLLVTVASCLWYRKLSPKGRNIWRTAVMVLLLVDEVYKLIPMLITGRFLVDYLPFHLCSINIFLIALHTQRPSRVLGNFLYTVCIPGALAALLFPSWTALPPTNYMSLHSFTVHILLAAYPIVLTVCGDIKPEFKDLPKTMVLLVISAVIALILNLIFGTNFMFLMWADEGNPLKLFEQMWGSHLLGFPVLIVAVIVVMYALVWICKTFKSHNKKVPK